MVVIEAGENKEHKFYMDGYHKANLDWMIRDLRKDYDAFVLYVGREGFGKSTMAFQDAIYVDPTFNLDRVVFTAEQFLEAVKNAKPGQAIVFDETMGYLSSRGALSKFNKALVKVMSEMRSKNLFVFLCIPNFFMMDWYVAQHRTTGLIYIYKRSFFASYDYPTKKRLYRQGKKLHSYSVPPNFRGRFIKYFPIDKEKYEEKKQAAINQWASHSTRELVWLSQRDSLIRLCEKNDTITRKDVSEVTGLSVNQISYIVSTGEEGL